MQPIIPARIRFEADTPISDCYGDSYFMPGQGLAESEVVFLRANRLAERFASLKVGQVFVIGETGFGTGLNLLLAARCFQRHAPKGARLHLISAELHPLEAADLAQALRAWPELAELAARLLAGYPPAAPGVQRLELADAIVLDLMWGDAAQAWQRCRAEVDAWFLDGFAPGRNPAMWSETLFQALARCSRPGASLGSFTAAGTVRRGLEAAGFRTQRVPGFGGKRHRIEGTWPGTWQARSWRAGQALIAGAGLAGATTARALAERGWQVMVIDPNGVASGASGNHAGVVYSSPSRHLTAQNRFYQASLIHALGWFRRLGFPRDPEDGRLNDVILQAVDSRASDKLAAAMTSGAWPPELLERRSEAEFCLTGAGFISPSAWCRHLLDHPAIEFGRDRLVGFGFPSPGDQTARCQTEIRGQLAVDLIVLCTAEATRALPGLDWLPLKIIRGQVSHVAASPASAELRQAICHSGYFTPAIGGIHCVGASFDLHDPRAVIKADDNDANLALLRENLPGIWQALGGEGIRLVGQRAALRCQSTDFLPLAGPLADPRQQPHRLTSAVMLNLAHGSRGITHSPLCASLIADLASDLPAAVDAELIAALAPERFILRKRKRDGAWMPSADGT